jgi:hypothetical protein
MNSYKLRYFNTESISTILCSPIYQHSMSFNLSSLPKCVMFDLILKIWPDCCRKMNFQPQLYIHCCASCRGETFGCGSLPIPLLSRRRYRFGARPPRHSIRFVFEAGQYCTHITFVKSKVFVSITLQLTFSYQTMRQKSKTVSSVGPWVTM